MIQIKIFTDPLDNFQQLKKMLKKMHYELSGVKNVLRYHDFVAWEVYIKQKPRETLR
jgi:hypothetical protein